MMKEGMRVLITGASSGLGEALAFKFAERGAHLTLSARRRDRLEHLRDALIKAHKKCEILLAPADISLKEENEKLVKESIKHFSGLDVFVANAGQGMWSRFRDLGDPDQLLSLMQTNYMGVVYGLFYSLPYLRNVKGSFIAISSIQGEIPVAYHTGYVASKHAVNGLIETIRLEEPSIHFLLALPSWISGTQLRSHALVGESKDAVLVKKHHGKHAVSTHECAEKIVEALGQKRNELFIPKNYHYVPFLRGLFKSTFDRFVMNKVNTQLSGNSEQE